MNASVAEQAVSTAVQSLIIVALGLAGGARYHGGVAGVAVMVAASIRVGVVFGALSNMTGMLLRSREAGPRGTGLHAALMFCLGVHADAADAGLDAGHRVPHPLNWVVQIGRSAVSAPPGLGRDRRPLRRAAGPRGDLRGPVGGDVPLLPEEHLGRVPRQPSKRATGAPAGLRRSPGHDLELGPGIGHRGMSAASPPRLVRTSRGMRASADAMTITAAAAYCAAEVPIAAPSGRRSARRRASPSPSRARRRTTRGPACPAGCSWPSPPSTAPS